MKKLLILSLVLMIVLALSACGSTDSKGNSGTVSPATTETPKSSGAAVDPKVQEELKTLGESVKKMEAVFNDVTVIGKSNGWENEKVFIDDEAAGASMIQVDKEIINDPSMLEGKSAQQMIDGTDDMTKALDTVCREKYSKPCEQPAK